MPESLRALLSDIKLQQHVELLFVDAARLQPRGGLWFLRRWRVRCHAQRAAGCWYAASSHRQDHATGAFFRRLAKALREQPATLFFQTEVFGLEAQLKMLRSEIAQLECAEHKVRAALCGTQLVLAEERDTWQKELTKVQAWARSQERAFKAESARRLAAQRSAEDAQQKAKVAHREAQSAAETKCGVIASAISGMRQQLDALQVSFDAEAARADAAVAHAAAAAACANAAEKRAAAAEAKVARMEEAEVQAEVSFILHSCGSDGGGG